LRQILFNIWVIPIYAYGTCIMLGFLFGILLAFRRSQKEGIDPNHILDLGIVCVIFGILGARLFFVLQFSYKFEGAGRLFNFFDANLSAVGILLGILIAAVIFHSRRYVSLLSILHNMKWYTIVIGVVFVVFLGLFAGRMMWLSENKEWLIAGGKHEKDFYSLEIFKIWSGGLVYYGGLLGAAGFGLLFLWLRARKGNDFKIWHLADLIAPFLALGLAFGRIGCFLNGCCWGKVANNTYCAFSFPKGSYAWTQHTAPYLKKVQLKDNQEKVTIHTGCGKSFESKGASPITHPDSLYLPETAHKLSKAEIESRYPRMDRGDPMQNAGSRYNLMKKLDPEKNGYDPWYKPLDTRAEWSYRVLPTQPLSFLCAIWLWIFLMGFFKRRRHNGETILLFGALYSIIRFMIEFCRGDVPRGYLWGLTISQTVSVFTFFACAAGFIYLFFLSNAPRANLSPTPFLMPDENAEEDKPKKKKPKKKKKKKPE